MDKITEEDLKIAYEEYKVLCTIIDSGSYTSFDLDMVDLLHVWITAAEKALGLSKTNMTSSVWDKKQDGTKDGT